MKKSNLLALCMLLFFSFGVKAQMVSTTTEYDTPKKIRGMELFLQG
jgi:hypothetical protein